MPKKSKQKSNFKEKWLDMAGIIITIFTLVAGGYGAGIWYSSSDCVPEKQQALEDCYSLLNNNYKLLEKVYSKEFLIETDEKEFLVK